MDQKSKFKHFIFSMENLKIVRSVRNGLIHITPVLIIGAFALILQTFPVAAYQKLITNAFDGFLLQLFSVVNGATFGVLSLYMTYSISRAYMKLSADSQVSHRGACIASILSFFILSGVYLPDFGIEYLGVKSMFLAILTSLGASSYYLRLSRFLLQHKKNLFMIGADREFNRMLSTIFPITAVTLSFAAANTMTIRIFHVDCFRSLLANFFNWIFSHGEVGFLKGFLFVLLSSLLWFCGIHGSDTLEGVMQTFFSPGLVENQSLIAAGLAPKVILTKEFFDCFVLMGGCGATICLLISILLFSQSRVKRGLGLTAAFPMLFNINELMVFGLPIVFNITMLIPFLLTPLVCYTVSYLAIAWGIVPMVTTNVAWTTPILLGGYIATGSVAGAALQFFNVMIGVLIYTPFVRALDQKAVKDAKNNYEFFIQYFIENEQALANVKLTETDTFYGEFAMDLRNDLRYAIRRNIVLAYQPQYHYDGRCIGVEALLRWEHPLLGVLYPPLVIKLAEEGGFLPELEERILEKALSDRNDVWKRFGENIKISVNVTATTIVTPRYIQFCKRINEEHPFAENNFCIEVTEQSSLLFSKETISALKSLKEMGILLAIDDFSMGQTSIQYLQENLFDIIKLDGSLVNSLFTHENSKDIILSITRLAESLNLTVLAEYVDSEEKRDLLHEIGCDDYQGYLYSPAVFL